MQTQIIDRFGNKFFNTNINGQYNIPEGVELTNVIAISAGLYHSIALKNDGTVVTWGNNGLNQYNNQP